jgi:4,5-dihydroxyphthalate decarboxylase
MTAPASTQQLKTAFNTTNPALQPLRDGIVTIRGVEMDQVSPPNIIAAFRHMCRTLEYDISEMAVVTYFTMRQYGMPVTAIPVFPSSRVEDGAGILVNNNSGITTPKDFEGKHVGMRSFAVTPCTWQKGYLSEHGVDLNKVHWLSHDDEHVEALNADMPKTIEYRLGANVTEMLKSGELDAAIGIQAGEDPNIHQLVPDARERGIEQFKKDGIHHLIHLMLVKNSAIEADPNILRNVFDAFKESKRVYLESLGDKAPKEKWDDPLPLGMDEVRASLERLMAHTVEQGILPRPLSIDELFPGNLN